ncbi:MAG: hypothetical protein ACYC1P_13580 [Gaiellaceae bacterium]
MKALKLKIAGATAALAAVVGGGAAVAATQLSSTQESDAIVADAAKQLGVSSDKLDAALKQALTNRVDAAVAAGRLTQAQATALKDGIAAGEVPLLGIGGGHGGGPHGFVDLAAAANFLGVTEAQLRTSLENGDTLAEVAQAKGKTAAGLVDALVAAAKAALAEKVAAGQLTEAQRTSILSGLRSRTEDVVNGGLGFGFRGGPRGPHEEDASGSDA